MEHDEIRIGNWRVTFVETRDGRRLAAFWPLDGRGDAIILASSEEAAQS